jgi:RNA polymerase sigma factor (sigma-70 family)
MKDAYSVAVEVAVAMPVAVGDTTSVPDTLETLIRRCHGKLLGFLSARLRNDEDAADLAQEAYTRLLPYQAGRSSEDLRRILFRIAANLLTSHWRRRRAQGTDTQLAVDDLDIENGEPSPDRQLAGEQQLKRLEGILLEMPKKRRTAFLLSRIEGLSNSEIAERCGISTKTVEKHIATALEECRAKVGNDDLQAL